MPQLDLYIFYVQVSFVFLFWIGYFIFIKTILPLISMELKLKQVKLLNNLLWFKTYLNKGVFFKRPFVRLVARTRGLLNSIDYLLPKKHVFFGIYLPDLLVLKERKKTK
jgi:hypothetical protein